MFQISSSFLEPPTKKSKVVFVNHKNQDKGSETSEI